VRSLGEWLFTNDLCATQKAYSNIDAGGADECTCNPCKNFVAVRDRVFPAAFLSLLESLGIDPHKDGEVYHNAQLAPGRHDYAGWYHFVGLLDKSGDFLPVDFGGGFTAWLCQRHSPALPGLKDLTLVELNSTLPMSPGAFPSKKLPEE
jgi:hypothetical protein